MIITKAELKDIIYLDRLINSKLRLLDSLKSNRVCVGSMHPKRERVQESKYNRQEELIIKILDLEDEIKQDIEELIARKFKIKSAIDKLHGTQKLVMSMRYLECMSWDEISEKLNYSSRATFKIHTDALAKLRIY